MKLSIELNGSQFYLLPDSYGIYLPQCFAETFDASQWGIKPKDEAILKEGPDHELYWETWDDVLNYASYTQGETQYTLWQDGDLFAVSPAFNPES